MAEDDNSPMTDDEKNRIMQIMNGSVHGDDDPSSFYLVDPALQMELDEIDEKLKEFQADKHPTDKIELNSSVSDFYLDNRLEEIDNELKQLSTKKFLETKKLKHSKSKTEECESEEDNVQGLRHDNSNSNGTESNEDEDLNISNSCIKEC